ncbi:MAG: hypothetical protein J0H64_08735 [Actinobacteria bacterium]|nr:hypothetical protein [Actinomycetota bacterium]
MNPFRLVSRVVGGPPLIAAPDAAVSDPAAPARPPYSAPVLAALPVATGAGRAHEVPWRVARRSELGVIEIEHRGGHPLRAVRVSLAGRGMLGLSLPRTVHPGERVRVVLRGDAAEGALAAPDAMLVLRWFEPDGTELLWPIAL